MIYVTVWLDIWHVHIQRLELADTLRYLDSLRVAIRSTKGRLKYIVSRDRRLACPPSGRSVLKPLGSRGGLSSCAALTPLRSLRARTVMPVTSIGECAQGACEPPGTS